MKRAFRYNRCGSTRARTPRGYARWLAFWLRALARPLRSRRLAGGLVWTQDEHAALLAAGFPALLSVPEPLFRETAALFPERCRLSTARTEEEQLAQLRLLERRTGLRFDWDAFLAACEKQNRRAARLRALSEALGSLAPPRVDARSPRMALHSLIGKEETI